MGGGLDRLHERLGLNSLIVAILEQILQRKGLLGDQVAGAVLDVAGIDRSNFAAELDQVGLRDVDLSFQARLFLGKRCQDFARRVVDDRVDVLLERRQHRIDHGRGRRRIVRGIGNLQDARLADDRDLQVLLELLDKFFRGYALEVDAVLGGQGVQGRLQNGLAQNDAPVGVHVILGVAADARNVDLLGGLRLLLDEKFGLGLIDPGRAAVVQSAQQRGND